MYKVVCSTKKAFIFYELKCSLLFVEQTQFALTVFNKKKSEKKQKENSLRYDKEKEKNKQKEKKEKKMKTKKIIMNVVNVLFRLYRVHCTVYPYTCMFSGISVHLQGGEYSSTQLKAHMKVVQMSIIFS